MFTIKMSKDEIFKVTSNILLKFDTKMLTRDKAAW
jgi:hypothetical protein